MLILSLVIVGGKGGPGLRTPHLWPPDPPFVTSPLVNILLWRNGKEEGGGGDAIENVGIKKL